MLTRKISLIICIFIATSSFAQNYQASWESLDKRPIPEWFGNAKFGIFIHWGVYSVPAWRKVSNKLYASYAEWYYARVLGDTINGGQAFHEKNYGKHFEYREFAKDFKAELFNPDQWAEIFKNSGAKYVVLTSKHHDGYCLWPTKSPYKQNWNSMAIGPNRDLVGELTEAVRKAGLRMGLYYSLPEWESTRTHRTKSGLWLNKELVEKYQIPRNEYVDKHALLQLKELVLNYQPAVIFSDGGEWDGDAEYWKTKEFLAWLYNEAPNKEEVVVNDRWAKGMPGHHGDYFSSEYKDTDVVGISHPWEESRGIGGSYGFNRAENLEHYSSSKQLIHELVDIVSRGGNLLLNVGPTADGRIPVIMQQRLQDIGNWLKTNGEAIYGSKASTYQNIVSQENIFLTQKQNILYLICTELPDQTIRLGKINDKRIQSVEMLGYDDMVSFESHSGQISIEVPCMHPQNNPSSYAWVFKIVLDKE